MQLPGVPMRGVEEMGRGAAELGEVQARAANRVAAALGEGFQAIGAELTKTHAMRAEAKLAGGLAQVQADLNKPYMSVGEIRDALGDAGLENLSPAARQFLTGKNADSDIVPTWAVGADVFAVRARKVREAAAGELDWNPGAQKAFEFNAGRETLARQQELGARYVQEQHAYQVASQTSSLLSFLDTARTPEEFDHARIMIGSSSVLSPEAKEKLVARANLSQDTTPIYDALRTNDVGALQGELAALNDLKQRTALDAQQRASFVDAISDRLRTVAKVNEAAGDEEAAAKIVDSVRDAWGHIDMERAAEAVAALPNNASKGRIRALVEHQVDRLDKIRDDSAARLFAQGQTVYESTKKSALSAGNINDPRLQTVIAQLDSAQYQGGKYARALRKMYDEDLDRLHALRERSERAPATPQQQLTYLTFARLGETPDGRKLLAGLDESHLMVDWLQHMDKQHREKAIGLWQDALKSVNAPQNGQLPSPATQLVRSMAQKSGIVPDDDPKKWSADQLSTMVDLTDKATQVYRDLTRQKNGQEPSMAELQKELEPVVTRGTVPGTGVFRDDKTTRLEWERNADYQAKPGETPFYPDIPANMVPALDAAAAAQGLPSGDEKVRRMIFQTMSNLPLRPEDRPHLPVPQPPAEPTKHNPDDDLAPLVPRWEGPWSPAQLPMAPQRAGADGTPRTWEPPIKQPQYRPAGETVLGRAVLGAVGAVDTAGGAVKASIDEAANYWLGPPKKK